ncbi:hypothetical protein [Streptomyces alfalfae]|nr:hypothetical protein [Streptomyces alfalfae]
MDTKKEPETAAEQDPRTEPGARVGTVPEPGTAGARGALPGIRGARP